MRNAVKVVLFSCSLILLQPIGVNALSETDFTLTDDPLSMQSHREILKKQREVLEEKEEVSTKKKEAQQEKTSTAISSADPITHTVQYGDSLTKIAQMHTLPWRRLFDKNLQIEHPDILKIGDVVTIPEANEVLKERPLPVLEQSVSLAPPSSSNSATRIVSTGSSVGNTYVPGYCTWYAKNRRSDLPNRLGNASSWVRNAAAQGFATGSAPRVGAIGQQGNHVVYVEAVNGDGTVTVSEMNWRGLFVVSSRTAPAQSFLYIY